MSPPSFHCMDKRHQEVGGQEVLSPVLADGFSLYPDSIELPCTILKHKGTASGQKCPSYRKPGAKQVPSCSPPFLILSLTTPFRLDLLVTSLSLVSMTSVSAHARLHGWNRSRTPHAGFQRKSSKGSPARSQTTR